MRRRLAVRQRLAQDVVVAREQRDAEAVELLVDADTLAIYDVVFRARDDPRVLLKSGPRPELDGLVNGRRDADNARALDQRLEFDDSSEPLAGGPRFVGDHDRVHELLRPGVLDLERLLVLESLRSKPTHDRHGCHGCDVAMCKTEAASNGLSTELVLDRRAAEGRGVDGRRERAADLELEGKEVATGLESVRMVAVALEKGPFVIAHDVGQLGRAERETAKMGRSVPCSHWMRRKASSWCARKTRIAPEEARSRAS